MRTFLGLPSNEFRFGGTQGKKGQSWRRGGAARNSSRSDLTNSLSQKCVERDFFFFFYAKTFLLNVFKMQLVNFSKRHFRVRGKEKKWKNTQKVPIKFPERSIEHFPLSHFFYLGNFFLLVPKVSRLLWLPLILDSSSTFPIHARNSALEHVFPPVPAAQ